MSAVPLIEAVQRAGGAIALQGDRLRLSAPEPLPEKLLEELRPHKAEVIDHLQHARRPELGKPGTDALDTVAALSPDETVAAWANGVARLRRHAAAPHLSGACLAAADRSTPSGSWMTGRQQAAALGWPAWELFGCHRRAPWGRIQGMGLVLLLRGDRARRPDRDRGGDPHPRRGAHQT